MWRLAAASADVDMAELVAGLLAVWYLVTVSAVLVVLCDVADVFAVTVSSVVVTLCVLVEANITDFVAAKEGVKKRREVARKIR